MKKYWIYSVTASLYFFYEFIQINMLNSLSEGISAAFGLSPTDIALLSSAYFYGSLILLIPAGMLLDRFSAKKVLLISFAISLVGTFMFAFARNGNEAFISRLIAGFAGGPFCLVSSLYIAYGWFKENILPTIVGVIVAIGTIGGIISQLPLATIVHHFGWRTTVILNAFVGLVLWVSILLIVKENKDHVSKSLKATVTNILPNVITNYRNWLAGIAGGLLNLPIFIFGALWGNHFLAAIHHFSYLQSSLISMMIYVGLLTGSPFWGALSGKSRSDLTPTFYGCVLCIAVVSGMILQINSVTYFGILFFIIGFSSAAQITSYSVAMKFNPDTNVGTAEGLVTWLILALGSIAQPLSGWLIEFGATNNRSDAEIFSVLTWMLVFGLVVSATMYYILDSTLKKKTSSFEVYYDHSINQ